jgi:hypothetical protein
VLRIVSERHGDRQTIWLHGRLTGEWVGLLERHWFSIVEAEPSLKVSVVLSDVMFIGASGEKLLLRMWRSGTELISSGCMNRYVIEKLKRSGREIDRKNARASARGSGRKRCHDQA